MAPVTRAAHEAFAHINYDNQVDIEMSTSSSGDETDDPEIMKANHRKSLILLEQSLMVPCDDSPIAPETLKKQEFFSDGSTLEKLMFERLLLRKELRLRTMQERLLDQEAKIEDQEKKIKLLEEQISQLTATPDFISACVQLGSYCAEGAKYSLETIKEKFGSLLSCIGHALCYLVDLIPPRVSLGIAALIHWFGNLIAQRAQNFSNERSERVQQENSKSGPGAGAGAASSGAQSNSRNVRRRRR